MAAAFLLGGRYELTRLDGKTVVRLDRLTGSIEIYGCSEFDESLMFSFCRRMFRSTNQERHKGDSSADNSNNMTVENLTAEDLVVENDTEVENTGK
jgi:hypothetical protein